MKNEVVILNSDGTVLMTHSAEGGVSEPPTMSAI